MRPPIFLLALFGLCAAATGAAPAADGRPNILMIMADDLDFDYKQDRLALMPNLRTRIRERGVQLTNHVAAQPVCGPSRSSLLAGRYPHNTGYLANNAPASVAAWRAIQNNTVGTWLTGAGYHTAYLGKYVNGVEEDVPSGWTHWGGFSSGLGTYNFYNATRWNVTFDDTGTRPITPVKDVVMTGIHQADFLGQLAVEQAGVAVAKGRPFFVSLTPTMVHWGTCYGPNPPGGYADDDPVWEMRGLRSFGCTDPADNLNCSFPISPCPTVRHAHLFDNLTNPHLPSWNASVSGAISEYELGLKPLTAYAEAREDIGFRNRTAAAVDLDDMIGVVLDGLEALGVLNNTLVIFTSDNGYHLGEHRLVFGKCEPFETDVRLPLYIAGPGIPPNTTLPHPTNHLDITATLVDLAGATPRGPPLDGLSFRGILGPDPVPVARWRNFSFSEFFTGSDTWAKMRWPAESGDPGRAGLGFQWWCTGTAEVFDHAEDPWELRNLAEGATPRGDAVANASLPLLVSLSRCSGAECSAPNPVDPLPPTPLSCANITGGPWDAFDP